MQSILSYIGAVIFEITGCFFIWASVRLEYPIWWVILGLILLGLFKYIFTFVEGLFAGRTYAAYGGIYVAGSLIWLWVVEGVKPTSWDLIGGGVCIFGAVIIMLAPRLSS